MSDRTDVVERLILAAGGRTTDLAAVIDELGCREVNALAVEEVAFRCASPTNQHRVHVRLVVTHTGEHFTQTIGVVAGEPPSVVEGQDATAVIRLELELVELVRNLYGPARERDAGTHSSSLLLDEPEVWKAYGEDLHEIWYSIGRAVDTVMSGLLSRKADLSELAVRYGTDKWGVVHWFTPHYDRHLSHLRDEPVRVLEIGIGGYRDPDSGGESLKMWKAYFRRGIITGIDVFPKHGLDQPRLRTVVGDQGDAAFLESLAEQGPFDVIVDDGSHVNGHVLFSFDKMFRHLRPGGLYVIEDLWTTWAPGFGGTEDAVSPPTTSVGLLKSLLDALHYEERPGRIGAHPGDQVVGVYVYHNVAFIEKGVNAEGGIPSWVPRSYDELVDEDVTR